MKAVGIKVLKDNLSRYLQYVREGETVYVTDRDTVIAEIHRPTSPSPGRVSRWEAFANDETRRGSLIPARSASGPSLETLATLKPAGGPISLQVLLDSVRAD